MIIYFSNMKKEDILFFFVFVSNVALCTHYHHHHTRARWIVWYGVLPKIFWRLRIHACFYYYYYYHPLEMVKWIKIIDKLLACLLACLPACQKIHFYFGNIFRKKFPKNISLSSHFKVTMIIIINLWFFFFGEWWWSRVWKSSESKRKNQKKTIKLIKLHIVCLFVCACVNYVIFFVF